MDVILPIIHPNGDRKETLLRYLETAYKCLHAAKIAMVECWPNDRNYYLEDGLFPKACRQHGERMAHINEVIVSVLAEIQGIRAQEP